jgi:hypothetical protein
MTDPPVQDRPTNLRRPGRIAASAAVVAINLAAFLPVWWGSWSVFALLGLYWFENLVLGVVQFLRMRRVERVQKRKEVFALSGFFAMHYGLFTLVHGIFVLVFFGLILAGAHDGGASGWWIAALVVAGVPAFAYHRDYVRADAARHASLDRLMLEPYARVVVLHLVVLLGAWLALSLQQPRALLLLLVGLKLAVELALAWFDTRVAGAGARA